MIKVANLTKRYRDRAAIENLTFQVEEGEIIGFLGPNGAGKTTTMRVLTGYIPATSGKASVGGFDVFEKPLEVKRRIGYLPEQPPVYPDMTVSAYLQFCAQIKGVASKAIRGEIERVAGLTQISDVLQRVICNLSKGYRQRVGLAQAILNSPPLLILDEPTVGLDPIQIIEVRKLIQQLSHCGKHTVILSTHILQEIEEVCRKVLIINKGKLVDFGTIEELQKRHFDGDSASLEEIYLKLIDPTGIYAASRHQRAASSSLELQSVNS
jgi:ABC-2 type transport system ATP-binding protein